MYFLSCHIVNFGVLSDFSYTFSDGINVIFRENGWGKSSFAAFLRAMLYGLPQTKKQALDENLRRRYAPWNGGVFGGTLVLEHAGKQYRVERTFSASAGRDRFELYDLSTNQPTKEYSAELGKEMLGIDADTFSRVLFYGQNDRRDAENTETVRTRLGLLLEEAEDAGSCEEAILRLEKERKTLRTQMGGGLIPRLAEQAAAAEERLASAERQKTAGEQARLAAGQYRKTLSEAEAELNALKQKQRAAEEAKTRSAVLAHAKTLLSAENGCRNGIKEQRAVLGDYADCDRAVFDRTVGDAERLLARRSELDAERTSLSIEAGTLSARRDALCAVRDGNHDAEALRAAALPETCFSGETDPDAEPETALSAEKKAAGYLTVGGIVLCLFGVVLSLIGVITGKLLPVLLPAGIAGVLLGTVLLLCGIRKRNTARNRERQRAEERAAAVRLGETMVSAAYRDCTAALDTISKKIAASDTEKAEGAERLKALFFRFGEAVRAECAKSDVSHEALLRAVLRARDLCEENAEKQREAEARVRRFCAENRITAEELKNPASAPDTAEYAVREAELNRRLSDLRSELAAKEQLAAQADAEGTRTEEYRASLDRLNAAREEAEHRLSVILKTEDYLQKAKNTLSVRYLDDMERRFRENFAFCTAGTEWENAAMSLDTDFAVRAETDGVRHGAETFSCGYRDLIRFCMRTALADALFPVSGEGAVLLLDDPFVDLDETRADAAWRLLEQKAERFQILFFTCHDREGKV